jgi:hypothetical protein
MNRLLAVAFDGLAMAICAQTAITASPCLASEERNSAAVRRVDSCSGWKVLCP